MNNELIILLQKAYDDGIITSIIQAKINKAKIELNLSDAEFQKIDDQIRITTYLRKVEERKGKGDVYIGDLTKQYKITEEEKILLKENKILESKPVLPIINAQPPVEPKYVPPITQAEQTVEPKSVPPIIQKRPPVEVKPVPSIEQTQPPVEPKSVSPITQVQQPVEGKPVLSIEQAQQPVKPKPVSPVTKVQQPTGPKSVPPTKQVKQTVETKKTAPPVKQAKQTTEASPTKSVEIVVLIVDDNPNHIALTKTCLEKNGYVCHTADSPETAFKLAIQITPSIVLCDFNFGIGKKTGLDLFYELRSKEITIPFIIISAYYQKEFVDYAFGIGVTDYLTKPFEPEILLSTITQHLVSKKTENNE